MSKESSNLEALVVTCDRHSEVVDMDDVRSAFGPILSEELQQWIDLSTRYDLESLDLDSPSEIVPPQHLSLSEMVNPRIGNTDNYIPHVFQSFLAGAMRIAQSTDEFVYVAALAGAVSEVSPVFLITDRYGDEIEAQAPSLESWLASTLSEADDEADEPEEVPVLQATLDPRVLHRRSVWLSYVFLDYKDFDWMHHFDDAPPSLSDFEEEKADIGSCPHLAVYWLWALHLMQEGEKLKAAMQRCQGMKHRAVLESISCIERLTADGDVDIPALRRLDRKAFAEIQATLAETRNSEK